MNKRQCKKRKKKITRNWRRNKTIERWGRDADSIFKKIFARRDLAFAPLRFDIPVLTETQCEIAIKFRALYGIRSIDQIILVSAV